jgi:quinoprotein glucose dehydrogenase
VARAALNDKLPELLASAQGNLVTQVVELVARHGLKADEATFAEWLTDAKRPAAARVAALRLLAARNFAALADSLKSALTSDVPQLRAAARDVIAAHDPAAGLRELNQVLTAAARTPTNPNDKLNDPINVNNVDQQRAFATLASMKHKDADALLATWADRLAKGDIPIELQVDLLEAATARSTALNAKTAADPLAALRLTLHGGDPEAGRAVFIGHAQGQCVRCHKIRGEGGTAGPDLTDVVKRNRETAADIREHLLQSLIDPNAKITPGFGSITLVLNSGRLVAGTLKTEDAQQVTVETADGKSASVPLTEIDERTPPKSAMPPMGKVLTPRELRDVIEFLATLTP